ncbi:MAG: hypothetical protein AB7S38_08585 [Vulcanimicrobiota bacterium]
MATQNIKLQFNIPPDWLPLIAQHCEAEGIDPNPPRGRTGGPAEWVRRLIARELGIETPMDPHIQQSLELSGKLRGVRS